MGFFNRKSAKLNRGAATGEFEYSQDEHAQWGVGGPAFIPPALREELSGLFEKIEPETVSST